MKKNLLTTAIFGVLFIALVAWFQIYEKRVRKSNEESAESSKKLISVAQGEIQEVIVERPAGPTKIIKLKLTGKDWRVTEPVNDLGDSSTITSLLTQLTTAKQDRVVDETPKNLAQYGLDAPTLIVQLKKSSEDKGVTLRMGSVTPTENSIYLQLDDKPTVLKVAKSVHSISDKSLKDFRNKQILNGWTKTELKEIEIKNPKETFVVKKAESKKDSTPKDTDKEKWWLARENLAADTAEWSKTLNALLDAKASDFLADNTPIPANATKIVLTKEKEGAKLTVWVAAHNEKTLMKRDDSPFIYESDKDLLTKLQNPSSQYQDKHIASFNRFDVKHIRIDKGAQGFDLVKEGTNWTLPAQPSLKINDAKIDNLLTDLQDGKHTSFITAKKPAAKPAILSIKLFDKKDKTETETLSLKFYQGEKGQVWGERTGLEIPFNVSDDLFKKLNVTEKDFEKKEDAPKKSE